MIFVRICDVRVVFKVFKSGICMPILLYGLDVCALTNRNIQFFDFTVNRVLMKLFKTSNIEIISECRNFFDIELPSVQLVNVLRNFLAV